MSLLRNHQTRFVLWSISLSILTIYLGYFVSRSDFWSLLLAYGLFFGLYLGLVQPYLWGGQTDLDKKKVQRLIYLGVALRVLLLFSLPNLSDDVYRFIWDGRLTIGGIHPFAHTPQAIIDQGLSTKGISDELFHLLNSKQYYTVYPPICQAIFALSALISPYGIEGATVVMKLFLLGCEISTVWILYRFNTGTKLARSGGAVLYALNPLAIIEITGNCHFEGAMICFMVAGLWALRRQKVAMSALFWALATASKLLPILFVPILWAYLGFKNFVRFSLVYGISMLLFFAPLFQQEVLVNMSKSINLYFKKFEYNASIYYLIRHVGFRQTGYNKGELIGPWLAKVVVLGVLALAVWVWWRYRRLGVAYTQEQKFTILCTALLFASFLHLACSTTVHPWYVLVPFALSILGTQQQFPLYWTGLVILSYSHYMGGHALEHYEFIALEYIALCWFWVWKSKT